MSTAGKFFDWNIYQVYPRSFKDSNGDGVGDLAGITEKLDYLKGLGINAVWISPCYKSPNVDNGYDISDYRDIMDEMGTTADWEELKEGLHARGMKLIMDFVANHTSDKHYWFEQARSSRDNPYHDYYYWAEEPLNDWQSWFGGGSVWEYNPPTGEYYMHTFAVQQPDLNWTNPKVRREMRDIVDFWVSKGVDGFRCDVIDCISKDFEKGKMADGPLLHDYLHELFGRREVEHIFTVGECRTDESTILATCGEGRNELKCVFQFEHLDTGRSDKFTRKKPDLDGLRAVLVKWQNFTQSHNLPYVIVTDNHDQTAFISRAGNDKKLRYESATMFAAMFYMLRGIPLIYQGQEIGLPNAHYDDISAFDDVETLNYYREHAGTVPPDELMERINFGARDNARRPMPWSGGKNYGFGDGKPWTALHSRGGEINVARDLESGKSVYAFYRKIFELRAEYECLRNGKFEDITPRDGCFAYQRTGENGRVVVVCNFKKSGEIAVPDCVGLRCVLSNYGREGRTVSGEYAPYEAAVFVGVL